MDIAIGNDHAGYEMKNYLMDYLQSEGHGVIDCGCYSAEEVDFVDIAEVACDTLLKDSAIDFLILVCGTGAGICMAANKIHGIRGVTANDTFTAQMAKEHNHANVICLGARIISNELAKEIINIYMSREPLGGKYQRRVSKLTELENRG